MDIGFTTKGLVDAVKKICIQLKPQQNQISFLLLIGKPYQGKSALLRQSHLQHYPLQNDGYEIFYNEHGIVVELNESTFLNNDYSLQYILKKLNKAHRAIKISGIVYCIDVSELLGESTIVIEKCLDHAKAINKIGFNCGPRIVTNIVFTKLDILAGFCEFFQNEHNTELTKPLGFSLLNNIERAKLIDSYKKQFDNFIEMLSQQIIQKLHPARSSIKRSLIREFPLQMASLKNAIQVLIQNISLKYVELDALYFTSAEQGGVSLDRVTKKIQNQFALVVQDRLPQATNYKSYFIEGAIRSIQMHTKFYNNNLPVFMKSIVASIFVIILSGFLWISNFHFHTLHILNKVKKELLLSDSMLTKGEKVNHLTKAATSLESLMPVSAVLSNVKVLKNKLDVDAKNHLSDFFLPRMIAELEETLINKYTSNDLRYETLKIYLMLANSKQFSQAEIFKWYQKKWQDSNSYTQEKYKLLQETLREPFQSVKINQILVNDVRSYLNALPKDYLYYSLVKQYFPREKEKIEIPGFLLAQKEVPLYFTKTGFQKVLDILPTLSNQFEKESWVLNRNDLSNLYNTLLQSYCLEYSAWWQKLLNKSTLFDFDNYNEAHQLLSLLKEKNSVSELVTKVQQETSPEGGEIGGIFNLNIASKFTKINLLSDSALSDLNTNLKELDRFFVTLAMLNDNGQTAFEQTRARFIGETFNNPLSLLFKRSEQVASPVSKWIEQIANDSWMILIKESKKYINYKWKEIIYEPYQSQIAYRYPFAQNQAEVQIMDFEKFFNPRGLLNNFVNYYLAPFLDMSKAKWEPKVLNNYVLPFREDAVNELIRANVITNMFFPNRSSRSNINFSLQKLTLDPVIANLEISVGPNALIDDENSDGFSRFVWPQMDASFKLTSQEGANYSFEESGYWALFKLLDKANVAIDAQDSASLHILIQVEGLTARYLLRTANKLNPFSPGILNGFQLKEAVV